MFLLIDDVVMFLYFIYLSWLVMHNFMISNYDNAFSTHDTLTLLLLCIIMITNVTYIHNTL
jgi:hypothetical protein